MKERILCASNHYDDGKQYHHSPKNINSGFITCGLRHNQCIETFAQIVGFPYSEEANEIRRTEEQGFLTNLNRWVDRHEALEIAKNAGQLLEDERISSLGLFSENLY